MKLIPIAFALFLLLLVSCEKNKNDKPTQNVKVEVIKGNNQSDTAGHVLADSIQIKVTANNIPLANAAVMIVQPSCAGPEKSYINTNANGLGYFAWRLNGTIGSQQINIYAIDSVYTILDSTVATAQGLFAEHSWLPCDCFPSGLSPDNPVQLGDQRIMCNNEKMYVSADEGRSWSVMESYPGQGSFNRLAVYKNHVFSIHNQQYLYHSADNGKTWEQLNTISSFGPLAQIQTTRSGKLFLNASDEEYMSTDLGQSWVNLTRLPQHALGMNLYTEVTEAPNGDIYMVGNGSIWFSFDGGVSWNTAFGGNNITSVFADDNGDIYEGIRTLYGNEIARITDHALVSLCSFKDTLLTVADVTNITKVNGNYYFHVNAHGLMTTKDFISIRQLNTYGGFNDFCVTTNNNIIEAGGKYLMYNINP
jgi:hypothetical protein